MGVETHGPANATSATVSSLERPHPRYPSATSRDVAAGLSPTVTVNRSNQHASGTLSAPESRTHPGWPRALSQRR